MKKTNLILTIVLVAQVVYLCLSVYYDKSTIEQKKTSLTNFKVEAVEKLLIDGENDQSLSLVKADGQWRIDSYHNLPANSGKVTQTLAKLAGLKAVAPAANTADASRRLKTSEDNYKFKLTVSSANQKSVLYVGDSPSFKRSYVSNPELEATYLVGLDTFELQPKPNDWYASDLLNFEIDKLSQIEINNDTYSLESGLIKPASQPADLPENFKFDEVKSKEVFEALTKIKYSELPKKEVQEAKLKKSPNFAKPDKIVYSNGEVLTIYGPDEGDYFVFSEKLGFYFQVEEKSLRDVLALTPKDFYTSSQPEAEEVEVVSEATENLEEAVDEVSMSGK